jgi:MoxR-like ATPase
MLAKALARSIDCSFRRIQFTPDLLPTDVTGATVYNQENHEFEFRPGAVFANVVLGDEINRASPKTQSSLLEAMEERQVTVDGVPRPLPAPFVVAATQNPIEYEGTYPLPEAQLDRFLLRIGVGYPDREGESEVLRRRLDRRSDEVELAGVLDPAGLVDLQNALEKVHVSESVVGYVVDVVAATRSDGSVQVGASPRGSLAILKLARGRALLGGRDFVTPDDVKSVAVPALAHRLMLRPELWVQRIRPDDVVQRVLERVPTPAAEDLKAERA